MFSVEHIAAATAGEIIGDMDRQVSGVSTDSRTVKPGELFVPLVGEHFDGHSFLFSITDKGISTALASKKWCSQYVPPQGLTIIAVDDTLKALGDLAHSYRKRYELPVVGITGSNGKTTTKEMLATILEQIGSGLKTSGNFNNLIGLPQMLFQMDGFHQWSILEMGMSEKGEIDRLAEIAEPHIGILLNAFPAHLESMCSIENVARAKGELLLRLPIDGCAIVNGDDNMIAAQPSPDSVNRITFGFDLSANIRGSNLQSLGTDGQRFNLNIGGIDYQVTIKAFGRHNIYNALAAAAAATALGIPPELIVSGLSLFTPFEKRFNLKSISGINLIDDTYNANPASTSAALATVGELKGKANAYIALGDMLELGGDEEELHRQIGIEAAKVAHKLYCYGNLSRHIAKGAMEAGMPEQSVVHGMSHEEIASSICLEAEQGDFILLKGSRGMKMEKVAANIKMLKEG